MNAIHKRLSKVDLFGRHYVFEEDENQKYTTILGIIMSFLIVITCCVAFFLFGKEIYQRRNPSVLNSDERITNSTITLKEFPFFYSFINDSVISLPEVPEYVDVSVGHYIISELGVSTAKFYSGFKKCNVTDFSEFYQPAVKAIYAASAYDIYCINYDDSMFFQNEFSNPGSSFINVRFKLKSSDDEEFLVKQNHLLKELYVVLSFVDSFIDSSTYHNPVNYYNKIQTQKISKDLLQRKFINIEKINFVTHRGWLFEDIVEEEVLSSRSIENEVASDEDGNVYWITLSSPNIRTKIVRSYMKVQELFAKIGGFFNALLIIISIGTKNYVEFSFYKNIYQHFYKYTNPKKAITKTHLSMVHQHTIDKLALKIAIHENKNDKNDTDNNKNPVDNNISNYAINSESNINRSNNNINNNKIKISRFSMKKDNNIDVSKNDYFNISNNNIPHRRIERIYPEEIIKNEENIKNEEYNNSKNNRDYALDSSNNLNTIKNSTNNIYQPSSNTSNQANKEKSNIISSKYNMIRTPIENLGNINHKSSLSSQKSKNISKGSEYNAGINISYFSYVWNDLICNNKKFKYQLKAVKKVLSFNNQLEVNYDYLVKSDAYYGKINEYYIPS